MIVAVLCLSSHPADAGGAGKKQDSFFAVEELSPEVTLDGSRFHAPTVFGPTGLIGWLLDELLIVREVERGSPADGVMFPNDIIREVNGKPFGAEPLKTLGEEVIVSEQTGKMALSILRTGSPRIVDLRLRKLPPLGKDWPFDCPKSKQLLADAARFLAKEQNPDGGFDIEARVAWGVAGLTWLATDDPGYLENCRRLIHWYHTTDGIEDTGNPSWGLGYMGTFLGEYYLRTGDRSALKTCAAVAERTAEYQDPCGSWTHGKPGGYGYVQGGLMNPAGAACWLALELFEECGIKQEKALARARKFFLRFVDNGTLPYGNHHPEFNGTGNSKDALACLALFVKGDYEAAKLFGRLCTDFPEHRTKGHTGGWLGFVWGNVAGVHNPHHPDYRRMLDHWTWLLHAGRRWDGGFLLSHTGYGQRGPVLITGGTALVYGVPNKSLRIFGAPESVFGAGKAPGVLKKGLKLYEKLKFDELREVVSNDTDLGRQLLKAAAAKEKNITTSLQKAEQALADGNPILAKSIAASLDGMCGGRLPQCAKLIKEAESDRYKPIYEAAGRYDRNRWSVHGLPECRKAMEEIAASPDAGIYREFAADLLATPADSSKWIPAGEMVFYRFWEDREKDPVAMAAILGLARVKGGFWPHWNTLRLVREAGYIKDDFVQQWQALIPATGVEGEERGTQWRYYPVYATKWEKRRPVESVPTPPAAWKEANFDDAKWTRGTGPLTNAKSKDGWSIPRGTSRNYIRIPFEAKSTDFDAWNLYIKNHGHRSKAIVYLNGKCIAWIDVDRNQYRPVELLPASLRHLKKGRNVLAVCSTAVRAFDLGLYARKK